MRTTLLTLFLIILQLRSIFCLRDRPNYSSSARELGSGRRGDVINLGDIDEQTAFNIDKSSSKGSSGKGSGEAVKLDSDDAKSEDNKLPSDGSDTKGDSNKGGSTKGGSTKRGGTKGGGSKGGGTKGGGGGLDCNAINQECQCEKYYENFEVISANVEDYEY